MRCVTGYAAYLRVYEPLGALPEAERRHWHDYVESGSAPSRPVLMAREHEVAIGAVLSVPPRVDVRAGPDHAYVRHVDGLTYVCPWRLQERIWEALEEFRHRLPEEIAEAFLPLPVLAAAEAAHDAWTAAHPDLRIGIMTSTWQVPIPWFVLFEPDERRLVLGERRASGAPPHTGLDRALVYVTAMSRARRRAARALHVVRRVFDDGPAVDALEEIGRWLEDFHPHSQVELDYGGLVHLVDDEALSADASVADVAASLEHLAKGDTAAAGEFYDAVITRWRAVAALEHAN
jgi:hypothetical protein